VATVKQREDPFGLPVLRTFLLLLERGYLLRKTRLRRSILSIKNRLFIITPSLVHNSASGEVLFLNAKLTAMPVGTKQQE
jgi:hypothetical protein